MSVLILSSFKYKAVISDDGRHCKVIDPDGVVRGENLTILQCPGESTLSRLSLILTIEFHLISPAGLHLLLSGHVKKPKHMNEDKDTILGAIIINGLFITIWCLVKFLPLLF